MSAVLQAHPPPRRPGLTLAGCQFGPCPTTDEASHVASSLIFHACRHQYPGGSRPVLLRLASRSAIGLPLNSGGSAPATNVSRPAQCLLALRPAWSLNCSCSPSHQSASVHVVASINRPGCYQPEPQLLRGVRTRQREAPYHGARRVRGWRASFRVRWYNPIKGIPSLSFRSSVRLPWPRFQAPAHQSGRADFPHPAFGRDHEFAHGRSRVVFPRQIRPWSRHSFTLEKRTYFPDLTLCFRQNHWRSRFVACWSSTA